METITLTPDQESDFRITQFEAGYAAYTRPIHTWPAEGKRSAYWMAGFEMAREEHGYLDNETVFTMLDNGRRRKNDLNTMVTGVVYYLMRNASSPGSFGWRDLPKHRYGAWQSVYYYYRELKRESLLAYVLAFVPGIPQS